MQFHILLPESLPWPSEKKVYWNVCISQMLDPTAKTPRICSAYAHSLEKTWPSLANERDDGDDVDEGRGLWLSLVLLFVPLLYQKSQRRSKPQILFLFSFMKRQLGFARNSASIVLPSRLILCD